MQVRSSLMHASASPPERNPTLDDVAREAGVSKMTVSRALRGAPECSPATRRKVEVVAQRLNYRANPIVTLFHAAVRRRAGGYHATLGWVNDFPRQHHHRRTLYLRRILRGAEKQADKRGFKLEELWVEDAERLSVERRAARYAQILRARGSPGAILPMLYQADLALQPWRELSVVCLGGMVASSAAKAETEAFPERFHHVQPDFFANMELACTRLRDSGYRRIGVFMSEWHNRHTGRQYEAAFRLQMADWPRSERVPPLVTTEPASEAEQERALVEWVGRHRPDVVLSSLGQAVDWLRRAGKRVPQDIGVAHLWLSDDTVDWSGVDPDLEAVGAAAVDMLIGQIQANACGHPPKVHRLCFLGRWEKGATTR